MSTEYQRLRAERDAARAHAGHSKHVPRRKMDPEVAKARSGERNRRGIEARRRAALVLAYRHARGVRRVAGRGAQGHRRREGATARRRGRMTTRTLVGAEIDSCSQPPDHPPHLRRSMVWRDSMDRRQRWLYCLGAYDQNRQLNAVTVDLHTEELVEEGGKPWDHPKTPEAGWDPDGPVAYQHWDHSVKRWT